MAIKTKKISDLGTIDISAYGAGNLTDADFYFLACKSGITGKVATRDLVAALGVGEKASAVTVSDDATPATFSMIGGENQNSSVTQELTNIHLLIDDLSIKCEMLSNDVKKSAEIVDDVKTLKSSFTSLSSIVAENTQNIEKLISFCQELQKDGYLTLAEIKKAASSAFPVSS